MAVAGRNLVERQLACALEDREVRERGERLAAVLADLDEIESQLQSAKDEAKDSRRDLELERDRLKREVRSRQAFRSVEVELEVILEGSVKRVREVRQDTGEVLCVRDLTEDERQELLFEGP